MYACFYINSKGNEKIKYFDNENEGLEFCKMLDKRIERGSCGGYSFTKI